MIINMLIPTLLLSVTDIEDRRNFLLEKAKLPRIIKSRKRLLAKYRVRGAKNRSSQSKRRDLYLSSLT
jgi:hypothetical protein